MRSRPSKAVYCKNCGVQLSYEIGSLVWQYKDEDLCPKCDGEKTANETLKNFRDSLRVEMQKKGDKLKP